MKRISQLVAVFLPAVFLVLAVGGCADDPVSPPEPPDEVLPNYVTLRLTNTANALDTVVAGFADPDGDGGISGTIDTLRLVAGATYVSTLHAEFRGKYPGATGDTVVDLTEDYRASATEHQLFYTLSGPDAARVNVTVTDRDSKNQPLGLAARFVVSGSGAGSAGLRVELGHYDDPARPKDGTRIPYERDIDISFPIVIR